MLQKKLLQAWLSIDCAFCGVQYFLTLLLQPITYWCNIHVVQMYTKVVYIYKA